MKWSDGNGFGEVVQGEAANGEMRGEIIQRFAAVLTLHLFGNLRNDGAGFGLRLFLRVSVFDLAAQNDFFAFLKEDLFNLLKLQEWLNI